MRLSWQRACCAVPAERPEPGRAITSPRPSHDLAVVRQLTDETLVLHRGSVVERGPTARVLDNPEHPCTQRLRASVPRPGWKPGSSL